MAMPDQRFFTSPRPDVCKTAECHATFASRHDAQLEKPHSVMVTPRILIPLF